MFKVMRTPVLLKAGRGCQPAGTVRRPCWLCSILLGPVQPGSPLRPITCCPGSTTEEDGRRYGGYRYSVPSVSQAVHPYAVAGTGRPHAAAGPSTSRRAVCRRRPAEATESSGVGDMPRPALSPRVERFRGSGPYLGRNVVIHADADASIEGLGDFPIV